MAIKAVAAVVGAAAAAVGTVSTIKHQKKMVQEQQKAMRYERQKNELQSMRQRTEAIRATRQSLANAQQTAANQGVSSSSSAIGGQGSIVSQGNANLSFLDQYGFLSDQAGEALQRAANYQGKASMWNAIAGVGAQIYGMSGGFGGDGRQKGPTPPSANDLIPYGFGNNG